MLAAVGAHFFDILSDRTRTREFLVYLPIEIVAVGDNDEGKVVTEFAQDLSRQKDH